MTDFEDILKAFLKTHTYSPFQVSIFEIVKISVLKCVPTTTQKFPNDNFYDIRSKNTKNLWDYLNSDSEVGTQLNESESNELDRTYQDYVATIEFNIKMDLYMNYCNLVKKSLNIILSQDRDIIDVALGDFQKYLKESIEKEMVDKNNEMFLQIFRGLIKNFNDTVLSIPLLNPSWHRACVC